MPTVNLATGSTYSFTDLVAFINDLVDLGTPVATTFTPTSYSVSWVDAVTSATVTAEITGTGFSYLFGTPISGTVETITASIGGSSLGSITGIGLTSAAILTAYQAEQSGSDIFALEKLILDLGYTFNGTSAADIAPKGTIFQTTDKYLFNLGGDDVLNLNGGDDSFFSGNGNDILNGGAGNDALDGGLGADQLNGGAGADILVGDEGNDILNGGSTIASEIDVLYGGFGNDTYIVNSTADFLDIVNEDGVFAGGANDVDTVISEGEFWWDFFDVGEILTIAATAASGAALISGKTDSIMNGNDTTNILLAYGGSNEINPGKGIDVIGLDLLGLAASFNGANTVKLKPGDDVNYIYDFESGTDKVDVSAYSRFTDGAEMLANIAPTLWGSLIWMGVEEGQNEYVGIVGLNKADLDAGDFLV